MAAEEGLLSLARAAGTVGSDMVHGARPCVAVSQAAISRKCSLAAAKSLQVLFVIQ